MVETESRASGAPPDSLLWRTRRLWFRSPDVALGSFGDENGNGAPRGYWKWNQAEARHRVTSVLEDPRLFPRGSPRTAPPPDPSAWTTWKPESRIAWREGAKGRPRFVKRYAAGKFADAARRAARFCATFDTESAEGLAIEPGRATITWGWIEGRVFDPARDSMDLIRNAIGLDRRASLRDTEGAPPRLAPRDIALHLRERLAAHETWVEHLAPACVGRFSELRSEIERIARDLRLLEPAGGPADIHGDFRPRNVIVTRSGRVRLCDSDHVATGEIEWDLGAWVADIRRSDPEAGLTYESAFASMRGVRAERIPLYVRAWGALISLAEIEEGGCR